LQNSQLQSHSRLETSYAIQNMYGITVIKTK
jgi:hypothetical protein